MPKLSTLREQIAACRDATVGSARNAILTLRQKAGEISHSVVELQASASSSLKACAQEYAHQMLILKNKLAHKTANKYFTETRRAFLKEFPVADLDKMPLKFQLEYYFAHSEKFTCPISDLPTFTPVKLQTKTGSIGSVVCDEAAIIIHLEGQVFDYSTRAIIEGKTMLDLYRQEIEFEVDEATGRPKMKFEPVYVPPAIQKFASIAARQIHAKADITKADQAMVKEFIQEYLAAGFNPNDVIVSGCSLLFIACKFNLADMVTLLLDCHAEPNQEQSFGIGDAFKRTALYFAVALDLVEVIIALLSHPFNKADPNQVPSDNSLEGASPAHAAVEKNNLAALRALAANKAHFSSCDSRDGVTPLYYAAFKADLAQVGTMLSSKTVDVDVMQVGAKHAGQSALFIAVVRYFVSLAKEQAEQSAKLLKIIKALVNKGANVNLAQSNSEKFAGQTPISYAESQGDKAVDVLKILKPVKTKPFI